MIDTLAGKTSLTQHYKIDTLNVLNKGWILKECNLKEGNMELGKPSKVIFRLFPPPPSVFEKVKDNK